jgi:hypothetical protein
MNGSVNERERERERSGGLGEIETDSRHLVFPTAIDVLSKLYILSNFVKNQLTIHAWTYF